jgi:hypothetical protein
MCEQKTGGPEAVEGPRGEDLILENRLVVYLDLLGFGDKSRRHHDAARLDIHGLNEIMRQWLGGPDCSAVEYALPMSDSYFFVAKPGGELCFLSKMALAMRECLQWSYAKDGHETIGCCGRRKTDDAMNAAAKNVRILPRGGMARGKVQVIPRALGIWGGMGFTARNLLGEAVTAAVEQEGKGKGARIFCDCSLACSLPKECRDLFTTGTDTETCEFLWPLAYFWIFDDSCKGFVEGPFDELWSRAMELCWGAGEDSQIHYEELLRVIIISLERWAIRTRAEAEMSTATKLISASRPPKFVLDMIESWG